MARRQTLILAMVLVLPVAACDEKGPTSSTAAVPTAPATLAGPMTVSGRAGYVAGVLPGGQQFTSTFVGAWRGGPRMHFCTEVLGQPDGRFELLVPPSCFSEGEPVYLTSGGYDTCVSIQFRAGTRFEVTLFGRPGSC